MKKYIMMACVALLVLSCSKDEFNLSSSIFVEDAKNPGLPVYSEWGYNTFGAYIDREVFVSNNQAIPVKVIVEHDSCNIQLNGRFQGKPCTLIFVLTDFLPAKYTSLIALDNVKYNLKSENCAVKLQTEGKDELLAISDGELEFKNVQNLYVDDELTKVILSGTFMLKTRLNNVPTTFSNGRFDLGVGYDNFYAL